MKAQLKSIILKLDISEAFRAILCMSPLFVAFGLGKISYLPALGQGGFFFSTIFLPAKINARIMLGSIVSAMGLGFYLIGGNVVIYPILALVFTFFVALNLSFLSNWRTGGTLALTFIVIYTAGLNSGSPTRSTTNFLLFSFVMLWSTIISIIPIWKPIEAPPPIKLTTGETAEQGVRMGIGTSIALAISYLFKFSKFGWAPSAVGNIVRYDEKMSKLRAWGRFLGTIGGVSLAVIVMLITNKLTIFVFSAVAFGFLNGLSKRTKLGMVPFFYTATILLLYTAQDITNGKALAIDRVLYNTIGILIGMLVVLYPFPYLMKHLRHNLDTKDEIF